NPIQVNRSNSPVMPNHRTQSPNLSTTSGPRIRSGHSPPRRQEILDYEDNNVRPQALPRPVPLPHELPDFYYRGRMEDREDTQIIKVVEYSKWNGDFRDDPIRFISELPRKFYANNVQSDRQKRRV